MKPEILIVSGLYDFSVDLIALRLNAWGVPFLRLNREQITQSRITLDPLAPSLRVRIGDAVHRVEPDLRAVWFRQPIFLRNTPNLPLPPNEQLERSQWMAFIRALCVFENASWMNPPPQTYLAESKPYQLYAAKQSGFSVPATLATNDHKAIQESFPDTAVLKSLDTVLLHDGDDCLFTYTTAGQTSDLKDEEISAAPLLSQHYLHPKIDLRVTVVGDQLFAVKILSHGNGIDGDWRTLPREELEYVDFDLPPSLDSSCRALAKHLQCPFAAIDLIQTPDEIFFIEVNPTGEWGWLCSSTRKIDEAIASWLSKPPRKAAGD